ncbi:hypothetical protein [Actinocrispum wychmicini]|uniref:Uncharacterized protein n=1 Tax=Actinocrispum wychmicini TaxID=1213861 RepID=A0A4V2S8U7_9PSEU|nr:hypothetical protein [Actinocrispum wychmicini]TCO65280.1 hypothetical protein EV192_1011068 [Actinocrispum wychmicini]
MQIFGQVWLWSLGSFLLGALFTWLLLVRPMRKRLAELETAGQARPAPTRFAEPLPGPTAADKSLDDLFDSQTRGAPLALPPLPVSAPQVAPPMLAPEPIKGNLDLEPPTSSIQNRLDPTPAAPPTDDSDTELSDSSWRSFTESTTVFVPPTDLRIPKVAEPSDEDWFARDEDPHAITDVEDDEAVDETGTIFTQHTTPIPAEVIRSLDESQPPPAVAEDSPTEMTQAIAPPPAARHGLAVEDTPAHSYEPEPEPAHASFEAPPAHDYPPEPVHPAHESEPAAQAFEPAHQPAMTQVYEPVPAEAVDAEPYVPEPTQAFDPAPQEGTRSLFEPVVPVAEHDVDESGDFVPPGPFGPGSAMPLPGGGSPAPEFNVKASVTALRYCTRDNPQFDRIVAEVWFRSPGDAERVGFRVLS